MSSNTEALGAWVCDVVGLDTWARSWGFLEEDRTFSFFGLSFFLRQNVMKFKVVCFAWRFWICSQDVYRLGGLYIDLMCSFGLPSSGRFCLRLSDVFVEEVSWTRLSFLVGSTCPWLVSVGGESFACVLPLEVTAAPLSLENYFSLLIFAS